MRADAAPLPERPIRERAGEEKRSFFGNAHSDRLDSFDGGNFVVGQVFCAETALRTYRNPTNRR